MKFLEAKRLCNELTEAAPSVNVVLAANFQTEAWQTYFKAIYASRGRHANISHLAFGGLHPFLLSELESESEVIVLLCPWDIIPSLDWRSGYENSALSLSDVESDVIQFFENIRSKATAVIYFDVPTKPPYSYSNETELAKSLILSSLKELTIPVVLTQEFNLELYFETSQPVTGNVQGKIASKLLTSWTAKRQPKKLIITDLDNTVWNGVIGEVGSGAIHYHNEGPGYAHYLYQTLLKKLKDQGTLIAAVSKNDQDLASKPFEENSMVLKHADMVAIIGSYDAKSAQISALSKALNLPISSFVFVDDNPIEIEEVTQKLPEITALKFSPEISDLTNVLTSLISKCHLESNTSEDSQRTELYQTKLKGTLESSMAGADLSSYLIKLGMNLTVEERDVSNYDRAIQLINKTNQFNINGRRISHDEALALYQSGAKFLVGTLSDRHGTHGEVLACVVKDSSIPYFVMSCRVMSRNVEYAFLGTILNYLGLSSLEIQYAKTERNTPVEKFLNSITFALPNVLTKSESKSLSEIGSVIKTNIK